MKKLLLLLALPLLLTACSSDEEENVEYNETTGYMTNLTSMKYGIVGLWEATIGGTTYFRYSSDGTQCHGYSLSSITNCTTYEIIYNTNNYYLRRYYEGFDKQKLYDDLLIITLDNNYFECSIDNQTSTLKRVVQ